MRNLIKILCFFYFLAKKLVSGKKSYIPASGKVLGHQELFKMIDASLDMWLTTGRFNNEFEKKLAKYLGLKYTLTVNSGSSANLLAVTALTSYKLGKKKLSPGDEVITVAAGFPTTVNPILQNNLVPVFVDVELGTYNIDINQVEEAITDRTKAIFAAHTLGNPFELEKIKEVCDKHNLWLIEDNCDALGAKYRDKFTGTYGHISTLSFYPAHHITMGEGGAVLTDDRNLYRIIMSCRDWGRDCWCPPGADNSCDKRFDYQSGKLPQGYDHKYTYSHAGYNLKITDWQSSIGVAQLDRLDSFIKKRAENFEILYNGLKKFSNYLILPQKKGCATPSWFGFLVSVKEESGIKRNELIKHLESHGIGTRLLFAGNILRQPVFVNNSYDLRIKNSPLLKSSDLHEEHYKLLPNTDYVMNNTFWTGLWPGLRKKELEYTISVFERFFSN